jgi:hypothetical protein
MSCSFDGCTATDIRELTLEHVSDTGGRRPLPVHVCAEHADLIQAVIDKGGAPNFDLDQPPLTTRADWLEMGRLARHVFGDEARPVMAILDPGDHVFLAVQVQGSTIWSVATTSAKGVFGHQDGARRLLAALQALAD